MYHEFVGNASYSVYKTAIRMPRFLIVVQYDGFIADCWRLPLQTTYGEFAPEFPDVEQPETISSSTPSVTKNRISLGVSPALCVPWPGLGMMVLIPVIAVV